MGMNPPPPFGGAPPPPSGPPGYAPFDATPPSSGSRTNGLAIASLVLGIVGILLCFLFLPWILAIIFGAVAIHQCNNDPSYTGKGLAIAGLVLGLVAGGLIVLFLVSGDADFNYQLGSLFL